MWSQTLKVLPRFLLMDLVVVDSLLHLQMEIKIQIEVVEEVTATEAHHMESTVDPIHPI